jgi:CubicO group peptidase (beta-lactamase class C family)
MKKSPALFWLFIFFASTIVAQQFETDLPSNVGFNPERIDRIDEVINRAIANKEVPGVVALVARNGKIAYQKSFGYADMESQKPMHDDAIFRIASMTKAITTTGVMLLYEHGLFKLNDPISKYIPEFKNPQVLVEADSLGNILKTEPAKREIRIVDLLSHSSGICYGHRPSKLQKVYRKNGIVGGLNHKDIKLEDHIKKLAKLPLLFSPGTNFEYSLSTDVLGYLCEIISGKPFDQFLNDEIFVPLKMKDTYFFLPEEKASRLVPLYAFDKKERLKKLEKNRKYNPNFPTDGAKSYFSGGGGLSSTAYDYARFIQMLLNNGELDGVRILSRKSVELMQTPRIDMNNNGSKEFALGFRVITDLGEFGEIGSAGTYAWGGAYYTSFWIDPKENLIGVLMSQIRPARSDLNMKFKQMVYQALE